MKPFRPTAAGVAAGCLVVLSWGCATSDPPGPPTAAPSATESAPGGASSREAPGTGFPFSVGELDVEDFGRRMEAAQSGVKTFHATMEWVGPGGKGFRTEGDYDNTAGSRSAAHLFSDASGSRREYVLKGENGSTYTVWRKQGSRWVVTDDLRLVMRAKGDFDQRFARTTKARYVGEEARGHHFVATSEGSGAPGGASAPAQEQDWDLWSDDDLVLTELHGRVGGQGPTRQEWIEKYTRINEKVEIPRVEG